MVELKQGDILLAEADTLANTVNCVGIMGRGIALQFRKAFPENFKAYEAACKRGDVHPGNMLVTRPGCSRDHGSLLTFPRNDTGRARAALRISMQVWVRW